MAVRQTEHEIDETEREGRKTAEQAARIARTAAGATERTVRAGAEAAQRNSERAMTSWRKSTDAANRMTEKSLSRFSDAFGLSGDAAKQTLQQSSGNVQAMLETSTIIVEGLQDLSGEWMRFLQEGAEQNFQHFDRILECRSFQGWMALHSRLARDQFEALLESARRLSEQMTQVADHAVRKMSETTLAPS